MFGPALLAPVLVFAAAYLTDDPTSAQHSALLAGILFALVALLLTRDPYLRVAAVLIGSLTTLGWFVPLVYASGGFSLYRRISDALVGQLYLAAKKVAADLGVAQDGYRTLMNCNAMAGQTVFHIHLHVLAGRAMNWPPG